MTGPATELERIIRREIAADGPMAVARYMELCLGHPAHGYYTTRDPLGAEGDFTTAPEISQMFGEMLGTWLAAVWLAAGRPEFRLVELGPGRGTLMADLLRVLERAGTRPEVWLVETSPALRRAQGDRVPDARWVERVEEIPDGPVFIVANEFLDALPVHQFIKSPEGWRERQIAVIDDRLSWGLSAPLPGQDPAPPGSWREWAPQAEATLDWIAGRLGAAPGAALIADYGYTAVDRPAGPTLQAVRGHAPADPLESPGKADLTWLVDFDAVAARLGRGARVAKQGAYLAAMGIGARAAQLAARAPEKAGEIAEALERLTSPDQMGTLFKIAGAVSEGLPAPPGFGEEA